MTEKLCPKCSGVPMKRFEGADIALPSMVGNQIISKLSDTMVLPVEVYRCPQCNFLELYAVSIS
jgi:hypothetical protein